MEGRESLGFCPILLTWMRRPVITPCGHTFDRDAIRQWFRSGHNTCPTCRATATTVVPNYLARRLVALLAPAGTLLETRCELRISVSFKQVVVPVLLRPSTSIDRLRRSIEDRFGVMVRLALADRLLEEGTVGSCGLGEGSVVTATAMPSFLV